jgi:general secretion pathway protein D
MTGARQAFVLFAALAAPAAVRAQIGPPRPSPSPAASRPGAPAAETEAVVMPGEVEFNECTKIPAGRRIKLTLKRDTNLADLVEWISGMTCKKFILGSGLRSRDTVTVIAPEPITAAEAYRVFLAALNTIGLTVAPTGDYLRVIESKTAPRTTIDTYGSSDDVPNDERIVTRLVRLKNIPMSDVQPLVEALKTADGLVTPYAPSNTLILTDTGTNIERILKIIGELDTPGMGEKVHMIRLQFASATEMAALLEKIFGGQSSGGRAGAARAASPAKGAAATKGADSGSEVVSRIIPDERTNLLILIATRAAYLHASELVRRLDVPIEGGEGRIHVYPLENADADELSQTLSGLAQGAGGGAQRPGEARRGGTVQLFEGEVKISADKPTNSLVVVASVKDFFSLREVIRKLDIPRRQVFVEATILEVGLDKTRELGLQFHGAGTVGSAGNESVILGGSILDQQSNSVLLNPLALMGLAAGVRGPPAEGSGELLGTPGGVDVPSFGVLLQALQTNNDVNVISSPHILTTDNVEAEITVGENVPFQGAFAGGGLGALAGAAGAAGAAGLGGLFPSVSVQRQDVALKLQITPHVNESEFVRLEIQQEVSDIAAENFNGLGPKTSKREAKTEVIVRDQQTVVIGGLMKNRDSITVQKVPLLGDIPILGFFFRNQQKSMVKSNLLLVLTPYVIRDQKDLRRIFQKKMDERREFIERYTAFSQYDPEAVIDYRHKHGLLEDINRTAREAEEEAAMLRAVRKQISAIDEGPVELPPGTVIQGGEAPPVDLPPPPPPPAVPVPAPTP